MGGAGNEKRRIARTPVRRRTRIPQHDARAHRLRSGKRRPQPRRKECNFRILEIGWAAGQGEAAPTSSRSPASAGPAFFRRIAARGGLIAAAAVLVLLGMNSFYSINEQENAVVVTFGVPSAVTTSGLHFKIPFVQQVKKVDMTIHGFAIGYDQETREPIPDESLMITSDYNFVNVDFFIEYRVIDPVKYLYASAQPELILKTLAQSYIRDTIGLYPVDEVITTARTRFRGRSRTRSWPGWKRRTSACRWSTSRFRTPSPRRRRCWRPSRRSRPQSRAPTRR